MPSLTSMGAEIEAAVILAGTDREQVRAFIWDCGCRSRRVRYLAVLRWAKAALGGTAEQAAVDLAKVFAAHEKRR